MVTLTRGPMRDFGLDISVKSAKGAARQFAPTWQMVRDVKANRITQKNYWYQYVARLCKLDPEVFHQLAMKDRHFKCYCANGTFCHTYLLIHFCITRYPDLFTTDDATMAVITSIVGGLQ